MRILVTGGGGFLGRKLCEGLLARGHQVVSFNRGLYPALQAMGVEQRQGDLADQRQRLRRNSKASTVVTTIAPVTEMP